MSEHEVELTEDEIRALEEAAWRGGASGWRAEIGRIIAARLADAEARAEAAEAKVARVEALADSWERECRKCPCVYSEIGYEGRDGIEPGEYCGTRHREDYRRLMALRDALNTGTAFAVCACSTPGSTHPPTLHSGEAGASRTPSLGTPKWMASGPRLPRGDQ